MKKIKKEEVEKLLSPKVVPDIIKKKTKVQFNGKQYEIRIPILLIDELNIKKGDPVEITYNTKTKEYSFEFIKDGKTKKKTDASNR